MAQRKFFVLFCMTVGWALGCGGGNSSNPDGSMSDGSTDGMNQDAAVDGNMTDASTDALPTDGSPTDGMTDGPVFMDARPDAPVPNCGTPPPALPENLQVAAGDFNMGCNMSTESEECSLPAGGVMVTDPGGDYRRSTDNEKPMHAVSLAEYWIYRTEVTQAQYLECVKAGQCQQPYCWNQPAMTDWDPCTRPNHPVVCVSSFEAQNFCQWREGASGRLPTEAEWEKAARGTDSRPFPWGPGPATCDHANFRGCNGGALLPVGSKALGRSPYGLDDMAGNAVEWVSDYYDAMYYSSMTPPFVNPQGPATPVMGSAQDLRVGRGGGSNSPPHFIRSADRDSYPPRRTAVLIGFRCVRTTPPPP